MPDPTAVAAALADLGRRLDLDAPAGADRSDPVAAALDRIRAAEPAGRRRLSLAPAPAPAGRRPRRLVQLSEPTGRLRRPLLLAAAAVLVALVLVAALPGPRAAVARLIGIGGVEISPVERIPEGLTPAFDLGAPLPVDDALVRLGGTVGPGADPDLGPPDAAFAGRPEGGVSLVWAPRPGLPAIEGTGAGLVLTAFPSSGPPSMEKLLAAGADLDPVTVGGVPGYWIAGAPHVLAYLGPDGEDLTARLAGNTLLWSDGRTTYRLESALGRDEAVRHARLLVG
jgi:hypothetical protein